MSEYDDGRMTFLDWARTKAKAFIAWMSFIFIASLAFGLQQGRVECGKHAPDPFSPQARKAPIATVGTHTIARGEWLRQYERLVYDQTGQSMPGTLLDPMDDFSLKTSGLLQLVYSHLLQDQGLARGLIPDAAEIDRLYEEQRQMAVGTVAEQENRSIFQQVGDNLEQRRLDRRFHSLIHESRGLTPSEFRELLELGTIQEKYMEMLRTEAETAVKEEAKAKLEAIRKEIVDEGKEFAAVAMEKSQDFATKEKGGLAEDLVLQGIENSYGADFIGAIRTTPVGEVSEPVYSDARGGWFLVTVEQIAQEGDANWEAGKELVRHEIMEEKRTQAAEAEKPEDAPAIDASNDEILQRYEKATFRMLFMRSEDATARVNEKIEALMADAEVTIDDPVLEAGYQWQVKKDIDKAVELLEKDLATKLAQFETQTADNPDPDYIAGLELQRDLDKAEVRYLQGSLLASKPSADEQERMRVFLKEHDNDFTKIAEMPELTEEEEAAADAMRRRGLAMLEEAQALNAQSPFIPLAVARTLTELEEKPRYTEALTVLKAGLEYAPGDLAVHQQTAQLVPTLRGGLDPIADAEAIKEAETWEAALQTKITELTAEQTSWQEEQQRRMEAIAAGEDPDAIVEETDADATSEATSPAINIAPPAPADDGSAPGITGTEPATDGVSI